MFHFMKAYLTSTINIIVSVISPLKIPPTYISLGDRPRDHRRKHPSEGADGIGDPQQRPGEVRSDVLVRAEEAAVGTPPEAHGQAQHHHRKHGVTVHEAHDHQADHGSVEGCRLQRIRFCPQDTTNFF